MTSSVETSALTRTWITPLSVALLSFKKRSLFHYFSYSSMNATASNNYLL
jgi:hypothetical protein